MQIRTIAKLAIVILTTVVLSGSAAQQRRTGNSTTESAAEVTFSLTRLKENPKQFSLALFDSNERSVSGVFSIEQLQILRAVMQEAEKFALNAEAVGTKEALTMRFMDKQEQAFTVDVQKLGNDSRLFLTLDTEIGRFTSEAGHINRIQRRSDGIYFDLLDQLESMLPKLPAPSSK